MLERERTTVLVVACLLATVGIATAHGNHLTVDSQVSNDGTVVVENFFLQNGGYLVLHADKNGEPGKVIGYRKFGSGYRSAVPIEIDRRYWRNGGETMTVWATLHRSDGDGTFRPGQDEIFRSFGGFTGSSFTVRKHDTGRSYVVAANPFGVRQTTDGPTVRVRNVSLAEDGYLAVHAVEQDYSPGEVVGRTRLTAGVHENVTVELNASFYESLDERFDLWAVAHSSDGDGNFDPASDAPVTSGEEMVGSFFSLEKADSGGGEVVNTPTETTTDTESLVNTPTGNATTTPAD